MPKLKEGSIIPTNQEDAIIRRGIDNDPDTYELSNDEFKQLKPVGRPIADVTTYFRATGKGWQTRINETLEEYVATH